MRGRTKDPATYRSAIFRAIEQLDLTLDEPQVGVRGRMREIASPRASVALIKVDEVHFDAPERVVSMSAVTPARVP